MDPCTRWSCERWDSNHHPAGLQRSARELHLRGAVLLLWLLPFLLLLRVGLHRQQHLRTGRKWKPSGDRVTSCLVGRPWRPISLSLRFSGYIWGSIDPWRTTKVARHRVSGHSRPVRRFKGLYFCIVLNRKNAFWCPWDFYCCNTSSGHRGKSVHRHIGSPVSSSYNAPMTMTQRHLQRSQSLKPVN